MVHPHIRGAYGIDHAVLSGQRGSSPPTWGILLDGFPLIGYVRFIPTYVGHTVGPWRFLATVAVHPHLRGAYFQPTLS